MTAGMLARRTSGVRLCRGVAGGNLAENVALIVISGAELHLLELGAVERLRLAGWGVQARGLRLRGVTAARRIAAKAAAAATAAVVTTSGAPTSTLRRRGRLVRG